MKKLFTQQLWFISLNLFIISTSFANVVNDIDVTHNIPAAVQENIVTERIQRIAPTGRIIILSNQNRSFSKGDFVSLIMEKKLVARSLVAKDISGKQISGIKIMKLYNKELWKTVRPGMDIQVLRGDDSYFLKMIMSNPDNLITDEEDLYNDTNLLEDDGLALDENPKRSIKTDNIIGISYGNLSSLSIDSSSGAYSHFMGHWGYQIANNVWGEVTVGQVTVNDFPTLGLDTKFTNLALKIKFTIAGPFDSYIMPYLGYQMISADSPGAGKDDGVTPATIREQEVVLVDDAEANKLIFGITVLKRLVPGWFARLDVGNDLLAFGFALEF